jgi:site-specific recombinase XerD
MGSDLLTPDPRIMPAVPAVCAGSPAAERRFLEFFVTRINNDGTRKGYLSVVRHFSAWCDSWNIRDVRRIEPMHIASYVKSLEREGHTAPWIKVHLSALHGLFNWLIIGQVVST